MKQQKSEGKKVNFTTNKDGSGMLSDELIEEEGVV